MIAIVDYGAGNLYSLCSSLKSLGLDALVTGDPDTVKAAPRIIVPGVGAFGDAMAAMRQKGLDKAVVDCASKGVPVLGICLGMQLLFRWGREKGNFPGLSLLPGTVEYLGGSGFAKEAKIPHMGWNSLEMCGSAPLLDGFANGDFVYYVHSYYVPVGSATAGKTVYGGVEITGIAAVGNVMGCQFHPEKSGATGLKMLEAFGKMRCSQ